MERLDLTTPTITSPDLEEGAQHSQQVKQKKGKRKWNNSKTYNKTAASKRKLERRKTAYAKSQNRKVVNEILRHGKHIKTEVCNQ